MCLLLVPFLFLVIVKGTGLKKNKKQKRVKNGEKLSKCRKSNRARIGAEYWVGANVVWQYVYLKSREIE